jgi:hypothetical protein
MRPPPGTESSSPHWITRMPTAERLYPVLTLEPQELQISRPRASSVCQPKTGHATELDSAYRPALAGR